MSSELRGHSKCLQSLEVRRHSGGQEAADVEVGVREQAGPLEQTNETLKKNKPLKRESMRHTDAITYLHYPLGRAHCGDSKCTVPQQIAVHTPRYLNINNVPSSTGLDVSGNVSLQ